jgi:hypothetical protein
VGRGGRIVLAILEACGYSRARCGNRRGSTGIYTCLTDFLGLVGSSTASSGSLVIVVSVLAGQIVLVAMALGKIGGAAVQIENAGM